MATVTKNANENSKLTGDQKTRLRQLESVVRKGLSAFLEVSQAILSIEREHLYLPHRSLTAYCWAAWDMSPSDVSRCRSAAIVLVNLGDKFGGKLPANESQARCLQHLKAEEQVQAWQAVLDRNEKVTAGLIREVVTELFGATEKVELEPQAEEPIEPKLDLVLPIDLRPIIFGLETIQTEIPKNKLTGKDREAILQQLKAIEDLTAKIILQIG